MRKHGGLECLPLTGQKLVVFKTIRQAEEVSETIKGVVFPLGPDRWVVGIGLDTGSFYLLHELAGRSYCWMEVLDGWRG